MKNVPVRYFCFSGFRHRQMENFTIALRKKLRKIEKVEKVHFLCMEMSKNQDYNAE